ncbi:acyltransferase [Enterobacter sp. Ap-1006]|uniref:acyltransferase family protein n=1 Tax=Enterobacter sp. Ap-1006 TaxID=2608345 RepID=UPI00141F05C0|nr:acyltransferase family protein [Enterobacter sp. Ap-1006]NIF46738.1 acyltransferase [Enterobacter sp. Ap-1006]
MHMQRFFFIDFIRAISFLAVVLFHFNMEISMNYAGQNMIGSLVYGGQTVGDMAISLFIIVSGFSLVVSTGGKLDVVRFFKKRIVAIYPAFWVVYCIVAVFIFIANSGFVGDGKHWKFILSLLGLDGFFLYRMANYYLVGEWYSGYMILTYLFFPILFKGLLNWPKITITLLVLIMLGLSVNYTSLFSVYINCNPIMRLPDFFFGMLYGFYFVKSQNARRILFLTGIIILCMLILLLQNKIYSQLYMLLFGCSIFCLLAMLPDGLKNIASLRVPIDFTAKYSFVAFLYHHQILYFLFKIIDFKKLNFGETLFFYVIIVGLSLVAAYLTDPLIKKVSGAMSRKLKLS